MQFQEESQNMKAVLELFIRTIASPWYGFVTNSQENGLVFLLHIHTANNGGNKKNSKRKTEKNKLLAWFLKKPSRKEKVKKEERQSKNPHSW